ncbi:MAG: metallophosphoesterase [Acutalibacteraceae bacterium]
MSKSIQKTLVSLLCCVAIVLSCTVSIAGYSEQSEADIGFAVIADIHYIPDSYCGNYTEEFEEFSARNNKQYLMMQGILESALASVAESAKDGKVKYLLIPGDLTKNGEYDANTELAARLERFEQDTGVQVIVTNGNHDVNNLSASTFENNFEEPARYTTPEEFLEIYKNLGYDLATAVYSPPEGKKAGMLSYSVCLPEGYRIVVMDGGKYSADATKSGEDSHETAGNYSDNLKKWILEQLSEAEEAGETVIGLTHWSLVPHCEFQKQIVQGFVLDNYLPVAEAFADAGMHYVFTGHSHSNDISSLVSDNGETIYDCQTNSLIEFPNYYREVSFKSENEEIKGDFKLLDVDRVLPVTDGRGVTYEQPYRVTKSFDYTYEGSITNYVMKLLTPMIKVLFGEILDEGGIIEYLALKGIDIEGTLRKYMGSGITAGSYNLITPDNFMAFVNDLGSQIDKKYIEDPEYTLSVLKGIIVQLVNLKVSELKCEKLIEYGYESENEYGSFGDAAISSMLGMWMGDEDTDDAFMSDVINNFRDGELAKDVFDLLYELLINQLVQDEILSGLYVNVDTFYENTPYEISGTYLQFAFDLATTLFGGNKQAARNFVSGLIDSYVKGTGIGKPVYEAMTLEETTYLTLINTVLAALDATGVLEGGDINSVIDILLEEYITASQYDAWGETLADVVSDLSSDFNPIKKGDCNVTYTYSGKVQVPLSKDNYRLPSLVAVSFGEDSRTTKNISWYTKYSVTGCDIEIIPYSDMLPVFSGKTAVPKGVRVAASSYRQTREYPGVDLGIIGILPYEMELNRHVVKISGLKPGQQYLYRVGDAQKGWWSGIGVIKTAEGGDKTTFIAISDTQSQNAKQYENTAKILRQAFDLYKDADFIVHAGDMVDHGDNLNQWKYLLNGSDGTLMNTSLMPVAGNHEAMGSYALDLNFSLPQSEQQETIGGYYYSFDYNNVHFMMLNTNELDNIRGLTGNQLTWLKNDAMSSDAPWKVVVLHKAVYSNGSHYDDKEITALRKQFASLMPQLGIDIVLQGHDHVYLRTAPMIGNKVQEGLNTGYLNYGGLDYSSYEEPEGTIYAITATAGVKYYSVKENSLTDELFPRAQSIVNAQAPIFAAIRTDGDKLYYDAYMQNGEGLDRIDSFAVSKVLPRYNLGDINLDGKININDARLLLRHAVGLEGLSNLQFMYADINGDGRINIDDARKLLRVAVGLEVKGDN